MARWEMNWVTRNLSSGERLGEVLFGLIMTLTFTLSAGVVFGDGEGADRDLLIATIGCNVAWGIIDAALFIFGRIFEKSRLARLGQAIRQSDSDDDAIATVALELDEVVKPITSSEHRASLYRHIVSQVRGRTPQRPRVGREDWIAALAVFWLVFFASLPAVLPFLFIEDAWVALRVSNALLIGLLFFVGFRWAGYTSTNRWGAGISLVILGIVLVAIAIQLGG